MTEFSTGRVKNYGLVTLIGTLVILPAAISLTGLSRVPLEFLDYQPLHATMEGFSIAVSILIFATGWNSFGQRQTKQTLLVSYAFLATALLRFFHVLASVGMHPLITENLPEKHAFFALCSRGMSAVALNLAAFPILKTTASRGFRYGMLALTFGVILGTFYFGVFYQNWVSTTSIFPHGMTPFTSVISGLWIILFATAGIGFYRYKGPNSGIAIAACAIAALSESVLTLYPNPTDVILILAHVYRVIAYWMFYRAVFVYNFRLPYLQLEESEKQLQRAVQIRDEFLSIASHELRTPLTPLRTQFQLAERELTRWKQGDHSEAEKLLKFTQNTESQLERITKLVNNLLDVATVRSGQLLTLKKANCSLSEVIRSVLERHRQEIEATHTQIDVEIQSEASGDWDSLRLEQVVTNLVSNALKYAGGNPVKIRLEEHDEEIDLIVQDQGPGIPKEEAAKIFEPFERGLTKKKVVGLGLGLYIARKIVEAHEGTIQMESQLGVGTTFVVKLPLRGSRVKSQAA